MTRTWITGWRGAGLAAGLAAVCALPGLIALPTVDRNEAVFVQGSAQMLEERNPTDIRFQQSVRPGSMPGAHWLQAAAVLATSKPEARAIWAYRLPSLLGFMVLVIAAVRGAGRLFGAKAGLASGLVLAVSLLGSTLADLATADALFAGASASMLAAFAYLYSAHKAGLRLRRRDKIILWVALIAAFVIKGPLILGIAVLAGLMLVLIDRDIRWMASLGWSWGLIALAAVAGPWLMAVTVSSDGQFWRGAPSMISGGAFGLQTGLAPLLLFPAALLIPFAVVHAWRGRNEAGVRLALAWAGPSWLALELLPGFQLHGAAGLYVAVVWLGCAGFFSHHIGRWTRLIAAALSLASGAVLALGAVTLAGRFGAGWPAAGLSAFLALTAAMAGAIAALAPAKAPARNATLVLGGLAVVLLLGAALPGATAFWPTRGLLRGLSAAGLNPQGGLARGPVASTGYEEPSLVFHLGAETQLGSPATAVAALADRRPAIVSAEQKAPTLSLLAARGLAAHTVYEFKGYDPADARRVDLFILKAAP